MSSHILSLHSYLSVNAAIMVSYLFARFILHLPYINAQISQLHKLKFARYCLAISLALFLFMPYLATLHPIQKANLEFRPVFHHTSHILAQSKDVVSEQLSSTENMPAKLPLKKLIVFVWAAGLLLLTFNYIKTVLFLRAFKKKTFCQHKIHNTYILYTDVSTVPFCWSFAGSNYIAVPAALLEQQDDKRLAIRHELQHIRQGDTSWLHFMQIIRLFCFWNPFLKSWMKWLGELQEYACDEEIILRRKTSPSAYAQCLVNAARHNAASELFSNGVIAINGISKSLLYRRVNMLFTYRTRKRSLTLIAAYAIGFCAISSAALALNGTSHSNPLTTKNLTAIIKHSDLQASFHIKATPEVVAEINRIRTNAKERSIMNAALERMKQYKPVIQAGLRNDAMPEDLLALPLIESGYRPLPASENRVQAAGIWQIIPETATSLGLVVNNKRDDRLNTELSTKAALKYLNSLYAQFHDWKLAVVAYEIGEKETERLINESGSRDAWKLEQSYRLSANDKNELKKYLAMFDASVIIMHNPELISE
jgi:beta-lactamase regulating signal transducer with metallopeptidase domain